MVPRLLSAFDIAAPATHAAWVRLFRVYPLFLLLAALVLPAVPARAEIEIVRLWTGYKETSAFLRLREFITGRESTGGANMLRTRPDERNGFYFTLRLADRDRGSVPPGEFLLQVVPPDATEPITYRFDFAGTEKPEVRIDLGLTGADWTHGKTLPLAWRLDFRDPQGSSLASRESFLWSENTSRVAAQ